MVGGEQCCYLVMLLLVGGNGASCLVHQMFNDTSALAPSATDRRTALRIYDRLVLPVYCIEPVVFAVDSVLLICASLLAGIGYHWIFLARIPEAGAYFAIGALTALNVTTILTSIGAYKFQSLIDLKRQARAVMLIWTGVFLGLLGIAFTLKIGETLSRGATVGFFAIGLTVLLVWRGLLAHLLTKAVANGTFAKQRTILIGERTLISASQVLSDLRRYGYAPCAIFEINPETTSDISSAMRKKLDLAIKVAREEPVESILLLLSWENSHCIESILVALSVLPVPIYLVPDHNILRYFNRIYSIGSLWTAELRRPPLSRVEQLLKRMVDLVGASLGLLLLLPLMIATAVLIKVDSKGPILFTQWRSGFNGRLFRIFKFRSMTVLEDGPVIPQATRDDARFTRLGRWLRRTNIDELPQLFNVLRGEMSLVGPRPHAAAHDCEYERQIAAYAFRYQLKPGITGWAQLNGYRGETRTLDLMSKRIEYDLWYIKNWSFWLDIKILLGTFLTGIWLSGGY
jgi:undecaprenyl-phosphate galactose phosphotransferase/putative colanic acid biosynthesis UDP-glucose lipid carrier transferase